MATIETLSFELPRRVVLLSSTTTMPDDTALNVTGDPNEEFLDAGRILDTNTGEFLINNSPPMTFYLDTIGDVLWRRTTISTWIEVGGLGGDEGLSSEPIYIGEIDSPDSWMIIRDINDNFANKGVAGGVNDSKLHFLRHEGGSYNTKAQFGDSIHTDKYYINKIAGGYTIPTGIGTSHIVSRKSNRGTHGIISGGYGGRLALISNAHDTLLHGYPIGDVILGGDHGIDETHEYFVTDYIEWVQPAATFLSITYNYAAWIDTADVALRVTIHYDDTGDLLQETGTEYQFDKNLGEKTVAGKNTITLTDPMAVDANRPVKIRIYTGAPVGFRKTVGSPTIHFENSYQEIDVTSVAHEHDVIHGIDNSAARSEWAVRSITNDTTEIHSPDIGILTDENGDPILMTMGGLNKTNTALEATITVNQGDAIDLGENQETIIIINVQPRVRYFTVRDTGDGTINKTIQINLGGTKVLTISDRSLYTFEKYKDVWKVEQAAINHMTFSDTEPDAQTYNSSTGNAELDALVARMDAMDAKTNLTNSTMTNNRNEMLTTTSTIDARVDGLSTSHIADINTINATLNSHDNRLDTVELFTGTGSGDENLGIKIGILEGQMTTVQARQDVEIARNTATEVWVNTIQIEASNFRANMDLTMFAIDSNAVKQRLDQQFVACLLWDLNTGILKSGGPFPWSAGFSSGIDRYMTFVMPDDDLVSVNRGEDEFGFDITPNQANEYNSMHWFGIRYIKDVSDIYDNQTDRGFR